MARLPFVLKLSVGCQAHANNSTGLAIPSSGWRRCYQASIVLIIGDGFPKRLSSALRIVCRVLSPLFRAEGESSVHIQNRRPRASIHSKLILLEFKSLQFLSSPFFILFCGSSTSLPSLQSMEPLACVVLERASVSITTHQHRLHPFVIG
jgi:hypothetical protein